MSQSEPKRQKGVDGRKKHVEEEEASASGGLEFEDPYGDDLDEEEQQQLEKLLRKQQQQTSSSSSSSSSSSKRAASAAAADDDWSDESEEEEAAAEDEEQQPVKIWRPGVDKLGEDEVLECDSSAYEFLHKLQTAWPCLSFDFIPDQLGAVRTRCPHTCYAVGGTQSEGEGDCLYIMKWEKLHRTQHDEDSSYSEEESEEEGSDEDARLEFRIIAHQGAVNRIRCCPQMPRLVAAWSDLAVVRVYDIEKHLKRLDEPGAPGPPPDAHQKPKFEFKGHGDEGFAMDWNPVHVGKLLTGDILGEAYLWLPQEGGWSVQRLFKQKHKTLNPKPSNPKPSNPKPSPATIEELRWAPGQDANGEVFGACSNDGSIKIWDLRSGVSSPQQYFIAHSSDVNSFSFSKLKNNIILSGGEEGKVKIFDLRSTDMPLAEMDWHKKPITCVDWHPTDEAVFAVSALDDSLTVWDMSVEREGNLQQLEGDIPEQLMFVHGGQTQISEFHFHAQIPGCIGSTASDGFNVFKTCNI